MTKKVCDNLLVASALCTQADKFESWLTDPSWPWRSPADRAEFADRARRLRAMVRELIGEPANA